MYSRTMPIASSTVISIRSGVSFIGVFPRRVADTPEGTSYALASACQPLLEPVVEIAVRHGEAHAAQACTRHRSGEELTADRREHRVGQNRIDHTSTALELG